METLFADMGTVLLAVTSGDAWEISQSLSSSGAWSLALMVTLIGGGLVLLVYRLVPFIDRHLERTVMVWSYLIIAGIIFVEVFRRFALNQQAPWSTTLPPFLFLIMTWFGCAYNVRLRTHLSFSEFRTNLPRFGQMLCLTLDAVLWLVFCWIVIATSAKVTANSAANFQILLGTDNTLQWWFLATVPIAFTLMAARVLENFLEDLRNFRRGERLIQQAVIGTD
ncbi:MAG: TRAP transporter small permease subunit [Rhodospirillales bacterium]|nr:TRAP transporter small permease subunit [Rhodospirillales bacterium]